MQQANLLTTFEAQEKAVIDSAERLNIVQNTSQSMIFAIQGIKKLFY
jgi:hypothetical protein